MDEDDGSDDDDDGDDGNDGNDGASGESSEATVASRVGRDANTTAFKARGFTIMIEMLVDAVDNKMLKL